MHTPVLVPVSVNQIFLKTPNDEVREITQLGKHLLCIYEDLSLSPGTHITCQ